MPLLSTLLFPICSSSLVRERTRKKGKMIMRRNEEFDGRFFLFRNSYTFIEEGIAFASEEINLKI
jgi:hypothetical protein